MTPYLRSLLDDQNNQPPVPTAAELAAMTTVLRRWHAALVTLSTTVSYSPLDRTGEASTRRIQTMASAALRAGAP